MLGAATYFVMSADTRSGVPPLTLAGGGLAVGALGLGALGLVGILPMHATTAAPTYAGEGVPWWLPFVGLGVVTAAIAYTTGIAASRRLGSRLASFVALLEVVAAVIFAWLLLDQIPGTLQFVGGAFIVGGVVVVKLGERPPRAEPAQARPVRASGLPVAAGQAD
jgi:drug/metabolite transporter (DMT)-like permease